MKKRPIIAFLYDFDKTPCTTDMQDYAFIPSPGYTPREFWGIANSFGWKNRMDGLLAYMYTMIDECRKKNIRLDRSIRVIQRNRAVRKPRDRTDHTKHQLRRAPGPSCG